MEEEQYSSCKEAFFQYSSFKEPFFFVSELIAKKTLLVVIVFVISTWQAMKRDLLLSSKHVYLIGREKVKNKTLF